MKHTPWFWGTTAALLLVMAGAALAQGSDQDGRLWMIDGASTYSREIDFLYEVIFYVVTGMFLLTEGLLILFCILYRRRPGHRPSYTHGNNAAEITWTVIPGLMLLGLALWQIPTWNAIKKTFPSATDPNVTEVRMIAETFQFNFMYPGDDKKFETSYKSDMETDDIPASSLHIPFGNKALVNMRTKDVIHSFFIPHMRVKQDTVPGLRQRVWFQPNRIKMINLKNPPHEDGRKKFDGTPRQVQDFEWVLLPDGPRKFEPGGEYHEKRVAVETYEEKDGLYRPLVNPDTRQALPVRVLYKGRVLTGQPWGTCDYALGIFDIACAELCGEGHYGMKNRLIVEPKVSFDAWLKSNEGFQLPAAWKYWRN